jgi:dethiobiotin synthetase
LTPIFITGIGTGVGKTLVSALITEALEADYWKPVQAGYEDGTDTLRIKEIITNTTTRIYPEAYRLKLSASPHIAAREEGIEIDLNFIKQIFENITEPTGPTPPMPGQNSVESTSNTRRESIIVIEGAGGLMVPLNDKEFVVDLIKKLNAKIILVSRNYLGSINHSLLTAEVCRDYQLPVIGWIFNDQYLHYEDEIVRWSGVPKIGSIPFCEKIDQAFILRQAEFVRRVVTDIVKISR